MCVCMITFDYLLASTEFAESKELENNELGNFEPLVRGDPKKAKNVKRERNAFVSPQFLC